MVGYNPFSLQGKTILVTGASSGIGRATAIECSHLGAKLFVTARNEERLRETFDALEGDGHAMVIADVTKSKERDLLDPYLCWMVLFVMQALPSEDRFILLKKMSCARCSRLIRSRVFC